MGILNRILLGFFLVILNFSYSAKTIYSHLQASQILDQQKITAQLQSLKTLNSANLQSDKINNWLNDPSMEPLLKEKLLYDATLVFREAAENTFYNQAMQDLVNYQAEAYLPLNDGGHIIEVAAFQVAASARATLLHWSINKNAQIANTQLLANPDIFINQLSQLNNRDAALFGYLKTIDEADELQINQIVNTVILTQQKLPTRVLVNLAEKTADKDLYQILIDQYHHNSDHQSLIIKTLTSLPDSISTLDKIALLTLAASKEGIADAAILALAQYVDTDAQVQNLLMTKLMSPQHGGSAAKAISGSKDLLILDKLKQNLSNEDKLLIRRSLLALYLNNSFPAQKILTTFKDSTTNLQLKSEVEQWLR